LNINYQANRFARRSTIEKCLCRIKRSGSVAERRQQTYHCASHFRIVIDDGYRFPLT